MNFQTIRNALAGKKTLFTVATGGLYLLGCWAGIFQLDEKILAGLGLGALGFLKLGMIRDQKGLKDPSGGGSGAAVLLAGGLAVTMLSGCSLVGKNAQGPTALERRLFTVTTNMVPKVETVTNVVTVVQTNLQVQQVTVTNYAGVLVPTFRTNVVTQTFFTTNTVTQTNLVAVPQLSAGTGSDSVTAVGGAVASPFGWGGVVGIALSGLFAGYLGLRNRALAGSATAATQAAGALTQNIETLLQILQQTPQGQAAMPGIKNYLMKHQTETGVIQDVATLIENFVNEPAAKQSADEILKAIGTLSATGKA